MKAKTAAPLTKTSKPGEVDAYMKSLKHPLADVVAALRQIILKADVRSNRKQLENVVRAQLRHVGD